MLNQLTFLLGMAGLSQHDNPRALVWQARLHWPMFLLTLLTIPAFYLELVAPTPTFGNAGRILYTVVALAYASHLAWLAWLSQTRLGYLRHNWLDGLILFGLVFTQTGSIGDWSGLEWVLRMVLVGLILLRLLGYLRRFFTPQGVMPIMLIGIATLMLSGAGFYWLEPGIHSYGDGLWLAFTTGATVGYGDVVPRTAAGKVFAVFVVLLGYAIFSLMTASIAAFFVGEDERQLRHELHHDIKALRNEVAALQAQLNSAVAPGKRPK
jgi:voltage-gated potassium channel